MTIRESMLNEDRQKKAKLALEASREARALEELRESERKFRAKPVPTHVYLPLYEKQKCRRSWEKID